MVINGVSIPAEFVEAITEFSSIEQWQDLLNSFQRELEGRIIAVSDGELPTLKHKIQQVQEMKIFFEMLFKLKK